MKIAIGVVVVALLTACATAYQPESFTGGFTETRLDKNVFRVAFKGNGYTSADRAEEMALLRSAELALQNGFPHFMIIDGKSRTDYSTFTTPVQANTSGTISTYGSSSYLNATTTYSGGQTFTAAKPSSTNLIMCFNGKPEVPGMVYDAQFVYNSLAAKYGLVKSQR